LPALKWPDFYLGPSNLFVWEAFVSGKAKPPTHVGDAEVAARAFRDVYPDIERISSVTCESPLSHAAAAMRWAGMGVEESGGGAVTGGLR
jgi:hypothetical protein